MVTTTLLVATLSTAPGQLAPFLRDKPPPSVLLTNILYADDPEMRTLLDRKRAEYPPGTRFSTSMHELARPVMEADTVDVLVVDGLSLWVSNLLLRANSDFSLLPKLRSDMHTEVEALRRCREWLPCRELIVLSNDVDFDWHHRTHLSRLYRELLFSTNAALARWVDRAGYMTNGAVAWVF